MRLSSRHAAGVAAAAALVAALSVTSMPAQAQDQRIEDGIHHFVECFSFMLTDEASHAAFCSPSRVGEWFVPESEQSDAPRSFCPPDAMPIVTEGGEHICIYPG